jgi:hypothetical protein
MKQTAIPTPGMPQVSLLAALKRLLGEQQAERVWREMAANPGRDIVVDITPENLELLNRMKWHRTK